GLGSRHGASATDEGRVGLCSTLEGTEQTSALGQRGCQGACGLGQVALQGTCHLRQEDLAGLEVSQLQNRVGVEELSVHDAALDSQERICLCEVAQPLGGGGDIT